MANMASNYVQCPDLVSKLKAAGALHPATLHRANGDSKYFENVLDLAKCRPGHVRSDENNPEMHLYPVHITSVNQLCYLSKYTPFSEPQWLISKLLSTETLNCFNWVTEEGTEPVMWQMLDGKAVSRNKFELEHEKI